MMTMRHMEVFHAIMVTGSVTGAARMLNISQPAVSATLKHCEARLKMLLFVRIGGRLQPTPEARALFPHVAAISGRVDATGRLVQDLAGGRLGTLSIAANTTLANGFVAKAVAEFINERELVRVSLQAEAGALNIVDRVISQEAELGIAYAPLSDSEVHTSVLTTSNIVCAVPRRHPLAKQRSVSARELKDYPIITYLPRTAMRADISRAFGKIDWSANLRAETNQSITSLMIALHGGGVAVAEPLLLSSLPMHGLVAVPLKPRITVEILLLRHRSIPHSITMVDFIKKLRDIVKNTQIHD